MKKRPGLAHFFKKDPHSRILTRVLLFLAFSTDADDDDDDDQKFNKF